MSAADEPILDVREEAAFLAGHAPGAVNIPLEDLARRTHELPPKGSAVRVFDGDASRLARASAALRRRRYVVERAALGPADLRETGPSRGRLWQPSPLLVEALDLIAREGVPAPRGRALDLACGAGREAVYLALAGYEVDAVDILPDALERARDLARRSGVVVNAVEQDLRRQPALPEGRYALVTVLRFLHRPLLAVIGRSVAAGGIVVYETFHQRDGGRGGRAAGTGRGARDGELAAAFDGFDVLLGRDGVEREGRVLAQLVARRRG